MFFKHLQMDSAVQLSMVLSRLSALRRTHIRHQWRLATSSRWEERIDDSRSQSYRRSKHAVLKRLPSCRGV